MLVPPQVTMAKKSYKYTVTFWNHIHLNTSSQRVNTKMENNEVRAVIKYFCLKKMSTKDIHADLVETLQDCALPYSTVARWCKEFKLGRTSIEDEHRKGRPSTSHTGENVKKVEDLVLADQRVTIRHLAEVTEISYGSIQRILSDKLHMNKVSAGWVLKMLTAETAEKTSRHFKSKS